ncbi:MAG: thiamine phosphate synthase [Actinobacteria bacterium]|nr:thiamine phosphate synthase [Actinomycetota bacterium]
MLGLKLGLYIITYEDPAMGYGHLDVARAALDGGADALQLRGKEISGRDMYYLALRMGEMVNDSGNRCLFFVNDRVDVAIAARADGVHLGQQDLPASRARSLTGEGMILGISATTVEEAKRARSDDADYLGVGPVFATPSKADAVAPIGLEGLARIRESVELPIVAIGGIDVENASSVFEAGADGIAVISAVTAAKDMLEAVRRLRSLVDACL